MGQQLDHLLRVQEQQVCTSVCSVPATVLPHLTRCVQATPSAGAVRNSTYAYLSATRRLLGLCSCKTPLSTYRKLYSHWTICCMFRKRRCLHNDCRHPANNSIAYWLCSKSSHIFCTGTSFQAAGLAEKQDMYLLLHLTQTVFHLTCSPDFEDASTTKSSCNFAQLSTHQRWVLCGRKGIVRN